MVTAVKHPKVLLVLSLVLFTVFNIVAYWNAWADDVSAESKAGNSRPSPTSSAILPDHPRLLITSTNNRLAFLRSKACYDDYGNRIPNCTPSKDWTTFINYLPYGYGSADEAWQHALVYLVTQDPSYRQAAINLAMSEVNDGFSEERTNAYLEAYKSAQNVAYTYDWLYDYLTPAQRLSMREYLAQLCVEIWNPSTNPYYNHTGWSCNVPGKGHFYSKLLCAVLAGLAIEGEYPSSVPVSMPLYTICIDGADIDPNRNRYFTNLIEFVYAKMDSQMVPEWHGPGIGGGWHEGNQYRLGSMMRAFEMFTLLKDAGGRNYYQLTRFPSDVIYYQLYSTQPGNNYAYPGGDANREKTHEICSYDRRVMLWLAENVSGVAARYAQSWLNVVKPPSLNFKFDLPYELLLYNPDAPSQDYTELPLRYYAEGTNWINSRSSWSDDAVSVSFTCTDTRHGHQHDDQNSFVIWKDAGNTGQGIHWLAIDANTFSSAWIDGNQKTGYHNTILVDGIGQRIGQYEEQDKSSTNFPYPYAPVSNPVGFVPKYEIGDDYTYVVGDASDAYHTEPHPWDHPTLLNVFHRQLVHILPDLVVVYDRITPVNPNSDIEYRTHFRNSPDVQGNLTTAVSSSDKLFHKTLLPADYNIDIAYELGSYLISLRPITRRPTRQFLNVMHVTSASTPSMFPAEAINSVSGNMTGTQIAHDGRNTVAVFTTDPNGAAPGSDVVLELGPITVTGVATKFYVFDLLPGGSYDVEKNGEYFTTITASDTAGVATFTDINNTPGDQFVIIPPGCDTPPQTGGMTAVGHDDGCADCSWNRNPGSNILGYMLYYGTLSVQGGEATAYTDSISVPGTLTNRSVCGLADGTYYFAVRAKNYCGILGPFSNEVSAEVTNGSPQPPPIPIFDSVSETPPWSGCVTAEWEAVGGTDIQGYMIYYDTLSVANGQTSSYANSIDVGNVTQRQVCGLTQGVYYFAVRSYASGDLFSGYSVERNCDVLGLDTTRPVFNLLSPPDGADSVSVNSGVSFAVHDYQTGVDTTSISVTINGIPPSQTTFFEISSGYLVFCQPAESFTPLTLINVSVSASDLAASPNTETIAWSFTTGDTSIVDSTSPDYCCLNPANGSEEVAADATVSIGVTDDGTGIDFSSARFYIDDRLVSFTIDGDVHDATLQCSDHPRFSYGTTVNVRLEVCDQASPPNCMTLDDYSFTVELQPISLSPGQGDILPPDGFWANAPEKPLEVRNLPLNWTVRIFDIAGNRIREFTNKSQAGLTWVWDFANDAGQIVTRGLYHIRVTAENGEVKHSGRFLIQRDP